MIRITAVLFLGAFFWADAGGRENAAVLVPGFGLLNSRNRINPTIPDNGSPFFNETYKYGVITMKSGRVIDNARLRVNLVTQETEFLAANEMTVTLARGTVAQVSCSDTTDNQINVVKLKTGYPVIDKQPADMFYVVLSEGRCSFLKAVLKKVTERKNDMDHAIVKEYETSEAYYLFSNNVIKKWKKDKDFILPELAGKQEQINKFIQDNPTNFRDPDSVARLIAYYNTLP